MVAANMGDVDIIQYLVDQGADLGAHDLGKKNDGAFGGSIEPLMPIDYAIGVGTFRPNNAIVMMEDAVELMTRMMAERGIVHTTSECTLRAFTCGDVDPMAATRGRDRAAAGDPDRTPGRRHRRGAGRRGRGRWGRRGRAQMSGIGTAERRVPIAATGTSGIPGVCRAPMAAEERNRGRGATRADRGHEHVGRSAACRTPLAAEGGP